MTGSDKRKNDAIRFAEKLAGSEAFSALFHEGMALVEETAAYLDGPGRDASKGLSRVASLTYATESMRLTTRLMQLASWLLLQRAVNEGEMSLTQAGEEKAKVRIGGLSTAASGPGFEELPDPLRGLIQRSVRLQERIQHLDDIIYNHKAAEPPKENPVASQLGMLQSAFGGPKKD